MSRVLKNAQPRADGRISKSAAESRDSALPLKAARGRPVYGQGRAAGLPATSATPLPEPGTGVVQHPVKDAPPKGPSRPFRGRIDGEVGSRVPSRPLRLTSRVPAFHLPAGRMSLQTP